VNDLATTTSGASTSSPSDVLVPSMTLTPAAGTYQVWFSGSVDASGETVFLSIYSGGAQASGSESTASATFGAHDEPFCCVARVVVNGSQAIEGRWRVSANSVNIGDRTLMIKRVA
jgi:hypothetical protein